MPAKLSVNLDAVAMLRNRGDMPWPSVAEFGRMALAAGAHGLTVHARPDQRHTRFGDLPELRALTDDEFPAAQFNVEGYPTEEFLLLVEENQPNQVTLAPDDAAEPAAGRGWDFAGQASFLTPIVRRLRRGGFRVSLFSDADPAGMAAARGTGADRVELDTGPYGAAHSDPARSEKELDRLQQAAEAAFAAGLAVNAGHGLTVANLPGLAKRIPRLEEVSIGHGLTADALEYGMAGTVGRFLRACGR